MCVHSTYCTNKTNVDLCRSCRQGDNFVKGSGIMDIPQETVYKGIPKYKKMSDYGPCTDPKGCTDDGGPEMYEPPGMYEKVVGESDPNGIGQHEPGAKNDYGKTRWSLLPWKVIEGVAKVMTFGANKYSDGGWKSVPEAKDRYYDALLRHKQEMDAGVYFDDDSGLPHWAHFCCNAVFLGYFYLKEPAKSQ